MGDAMNDQYADSRTLQSNVENCQKEAASIQSELDRAVQNFGQGMQRGMETCQRQAQASMSNGGSESGQFFAFISITVDDSSNLIFASSSASRTDSRHSWLN